MQTQEEIQRVLKEQMESHDVQRALQVTTLTFEKLIRSCHNELKNAGLCHRCRRIRAQST